MQTVQKQIIEDYIHAYNTLDVDGMIKNLAEHVVFENVSNGTVDLRTEGKANFKAQAESAKQYFTKRQQTITSWEFKNQNVIINIDYNAILAIDLPNGLKAGDTLELKGTSEFEFEDDKIVKIVDKS
ncbi:nuclear transport factor 2 family protein [Winogradskyella sp. 3972H.M.0a.05]|uniref:nuclear transport factor 2 family protein n=1 Tax=Winogradskyella sp. 3972H.M.0a.05 TaxID=2950277 RepID=UPI00339694E0